MPEHLVVIGAGYIGLELGSRLAAARRQGHRAEYLDRILPGMDSEIADEAQKASSNSRASSSGSGTQVTGARVEGQRSARGQSRAAEPWSVDRVLVAVGRTPTPTASGSTALGIELDQQGRIPVDDASRPTSPGIYAIGDVIRGPMLAHKAEEEGSRLRRAHRRPATGT